MTIASGFGKPTVPEVLPLVQAVYRRSPTGCCLHIVLDDGNVDDASVVRCHLQAVDRDHPDCEELASKLLQMSKTQRCVLSARALEVRR